MERRHFLSILSTATVVTCLAAPACSSDTPAPARVTIDSAMSTGSHSSADCPDSGGWLKIGDFGNPSASPPVPVAPVENGGPYDQGTVSVSCSVTASNDGFQMSAHAELAGSPDAGTITISGFMAANQSDQQNISVTVSHNGSVYHQKNCVARYTDPNMAVAAGRVWAVAECDDVNDDEHQRVCQYNVTFRFENCGQ